MNIFLVSAPNETVEFNKKDDHLSPLGIYYLTSIIEKEGHKVTTLDYFHKPLETIEKDFFALIKKEKPDIIGFSILTMNRTATFDLVKKIHRKYPEIKIMAGGVHCYTLYEQILKNYPIDVICIGEGETTIINIINNIHSRNFANILGIAYMENGTVIKTAPPLPIQDLDTVPYPKHSCYIKPETTTAYMMTSRGCPGRCIFCSTSAYWRAWRSRTAKSVVDEIEFIVTQHPQIKKIFFHDDSFNISNQRIIDICKDMIKRKIKIEWACSARVHPLSLKMLKWMKKAGCTTIALGIESGSVKLLSELQKFITREQIIKAFKACKKAGIQANPFLMVGLPGETNETIDETIDLLKKINYGAETCAVLDIYPNTKIYDLAKQKGLISDDFWLTRKKIIPFTYDHDYVELNRMRMRVIMESIKNHSIWHLITFVAKKFILQPKLTMINIKNVLFKPKDL